MERPRFLLAPGAGAPSSHPWLRAWAARLETIGSVATFDYDYLRAGRKRPDRLPELIAAHREALQELREQAGGPLVLIGKSMGSRIGCHLSLEEEVGGLVCLGYPLCGGGDPTKLRDKILREIATPILFVQGTRDALCPLELLENVRHEMTPANELFVVEGGDHSLAVTKRQLQANGETQEDVDARILSRIESFLKHRAKTE